ncbi:MAG: hypothetical protein AAF264_08960, partial [Pseudomonadota bacterium]
MPAQAALVRYDITRATFYENVNGARSGYDDGRTPPNIPRINGSMTGHFVYDMSLGAMVSVAIDTVGFDDPFFNRSYDLLLTSGAESGLVGSAPGVRNGQPFLQFFYSSQLGGLDKRPSNIRFRYEDRVSSAPSIFY